MARVVSAVFLLIAFAACGGQPGQRGGDEQAEPGDTVAAPAQPSPEPGSGATADPAGAEAAVAVVRDYYAAIAAGDYARAYGYWAGNGEASGQTFEEFRSGYAETARVRVNTGEPGRIEPAAGSRYIDVPVTVSAGTTAGGEQCFRGTYALRRSEVPGATDAQRSWRIHSADLREVGGDQCADRPRRPGADSAAAVVEAFGGQLASVSVLAPPEVLRDDIRTRYGPLVTPDLLASWLRDPTAAPGREVSSPWPDRIVIDELTSIADGRFRATGEVIYITSTEAGTAAAADRRPVTIEILRTPEGWRIASFRQS